MKSWDNAGDVPAQACLPSVNVKTSLKDWKKVYRRLKNLEELDEHERILYGEGMNWLPDMDLNHDKQIQSLLCYRYTIGQTGAVKVGFWLPESRRTAGVRDDAGTSQVSNRLVSRADCCAGERPCSASRRLFTHHVSRIA
jgi:hypothetical protein